MADKASFALGVGIMALSVWAVASAIHWPWKAALFPLALGVPVFCLAAAEVLWGVFGPASERVSTDARLSSPLTDDAVAPRRTLLAIVWMLGFFAAIALLGFLIAVPLFVFCYVKLQGRERWGGSLLFTLAVWAVFYGLFDRLLHLPFPDGWIQTWFGLT